MYRFNPSTRFTYRQTCIILWHIFQRLSYFLTCLLPIPFIATWLSCWLSWHKKKVPSGSNKNNYANVDLIVDIAVSQKVQTSQKYTDYTIWHNIHHKWLWYFLTNSQPPPLLLLLPLSFSCFVGGRCMAWLGSCFREPPSSLDPQGEGHSVHWSHRTCHGCPRRQGLCQYLGTDCRRSFHPLVRRWYQKWSQCRRRYP